MDYLKALHGELTCSGGCVVGVCGRGWVCGRGVGGLLYVRVVGVWHRTSVVSIMAEREWFHQVSYVIALKPVVIVPR
jgi:hypothetical protein